MLVFHAFAVSLLQLLAFAYSETFIGPPSSLCNSSIDEFNGTGIVSFDPHFSSAQMPDGGFDAWTSTYVGYNMSSASWLTAVHSVFNDSYETSLWFNPAGQEYWNDEQTLFDACAIIIPPQLPINTLRLSQTDPGDCTIMLSPGCRSALTSQAAASAAKWITYASPPPNTNLTAGILPWLCSQIASELAWKPFPPGVSTTSEFVFLYPEECSQDLGYGTTGSLLNPSIITLTGNNQSQTPSSYGTLPHDWQCPVLGANGSSKDYGSYGFTFGPYDEQMSVAIPILTVYFAIANEIALPRIDLVEISSSQLSCPRITNVSANSRATTPLPPSTPYPSSSGTQLSKEELAGIIVGCGISVLLVALVGVYWQWRRVKRRRHLTTERTKFDGNFQETDINAHESASSDKYELSSADRKPELERNDIAEVEGV